MVEPVKVQITEDVETRVRLHATVELDDASGVEPLGIAVQVLVGRHLSRDKEQEDQTIYHIATRTHNHDRFYCTCTYICMYMYEGGLQSIPIAT